MYAMSLGDDKKTGCCGVGTRRFFAGLELTTFDAIVVPVVVNATRRRFFRAQLNMMLNSTANSTTATMVLPPKNVT